jgi:hypothetical protein
VKCGGGVVACLTVKEALELGFNNEDVEGYCDRAQSLRGSRCIGGLDEAVFVQGRLLEKHYVIIIRQM